MDEANMVNELFYFMPGQVILHLEHSEEAEDLLNVWVSEFLKTSGPPWNQFLPTRTITFPIICSESGKKISLALTQLAIPPIPPMEDYRKKVYTYQGELIDLLGKMYDWIDKYGHEFGDDITLRTVSPNWLTGSAPHLPGTGGPGSWPVRAEPSSDDEWKFSFPFLPNSSDFINSIAGEGVEVAILDTAHKPDILRGAHSQWPGHPLVEGLLGDQGMLMSSKGVPNVVPYEFSQEEIWDYTESGRDYFLKPWEHFRLEDHHYEMPDHGLFVAGIIHTIAPLAQLKLYEVLDQYGVGSYASIASGLNSVLLDYDPDHKLIINLSLVLRMPYTDANGFQHVDPGLTDRHADKIKYFIRMGESIRETFNCLVEQDNVLVVAAAGNDSHSEDARPPARYPAVCPGVIGVGAMPKDSQSTGPGHHRVASYSNLCDKPPFSQDAKVSGYVTVGGEAGPRRGILGVYIHDIPSHNGSTPPLTHDQIQYDPNDTGWAWWAGTSFATPIISGLLAAGWSKNWESLPQSPGPTGPISAVRDLGFGEISAEIPPILRAMQPDLADRAHNFLHQASGASQRQSHRTPANERVIEARQP